MLYTCHITYDGYTVTTRLSEPRLFPHIHHGEDTVGDKVEGLHTSSFLFVFRWYAMSYVAPVF